MRGFTLVEVLVALVVLEVGLLGVVGTLLLAGMTVREAQGLERAVAEMERVADSLGTASREGEGQTAVPGGWVTWRRTSSGAWDVTYRPAGGGVAAVVRGGGAVAEGW